MFKKGDVVRIKESAIELAAGLTKQHGYLFVVNEELYLVGFCLGTSVASGKQAVLRYSELEKADV